MKYKRIYIEITNQCNLQCSFCSKTRRPKRTMTKEEFEQIIKKIKPYTNTIYLHVKGEPLLHPELNELLDICEKYQMNVTITTNATLLTKQYFILKSHPCISHINLSLHSYSGKKDKITEILATATKLSTDKTIIYRLWAQTSKSLSKEATEIVDKIKEWHHLSTEKVEEIKREKNIKIQKNIYIDKDGLFDWPTDAKSKKEDGYCYGLKTHIAILSDGTVVPCCLDAEGDIALGNILKEELDAIIHSTKAKNIIMGFRNRTCVDPLCKQCTYKERF